MQSGPGGGAQCALHPGIGANFVCSRCGNFMCASCSVNGTEQQCPTCRALHPVGFPYDANADLSTLFSYTTAAFQREVAMVIVAGLIFFAFAMAGAVVSNIINSIVGSIFDIHVDPSNPFGDLRAAMQNFGISQLSATVVNLAVQGIALVGLYRVLLDVLVGKKADLARMFSQLHLVPQYIAMHLIMFFMITLPTVIYFGIVGTAGVRLVGLNWNRLRDFNPESLLNPAVIGLFFGSLLLYTAAMVVVLPISMFATPELIVGQCGPVEALKRAWDLGEGQRLRTFGYAFVAGAIILAGLMACCVGIIAAFPVAYMLVLALFLALRKSSSLPPAIH